MSRAISISDHSKSRILSRVPRLPPVKVLAWVLVFFVLMMMGYVGKRRATVQGRMDYVTEVRQELQHGLHVAMNPLDPMLTSLPGPVDPGRQTLAQPRQFESSMRTLEAVLQRFNSRESREGLNPDQLLEVRLANAALALARGAYSDALVLVTAEDEKPPARDSQSVDVIALRADAHFGLRQWTEALPRYRQVVTAQSNRLDTTAFVAACHFALGDRDDGIAQLQELARSRLAQGRVALSRADDRQAEVHFAEAVRIAAALARGNAGNGPPDVLVAGHEGLGHVRSLRNDVTDAVAQYRSALRIHGDSHAAADASATPARLLSAARLHLNLGQALLHQQQTREAMSHFTQAERAWMHWQAGESLDVLCATYIQLGNAHVNQGQLPEAIEYYSKCVETVLGLDESRRVPGMAHDLGLSLNNRGVARRLAGDDAAALADFDQAIESLEAAGLALGKKPPAVHGGLEGESGSLPIKFEVLMGYSENALDALVRTRATHRNPDRALRAILGVSLKNRGVAHQDQGRWQEARQDFAAAVETYAYLVEQKGEMDLAAQYARHLTALAWMYVTHPQGDKPDAAKNALNLAVKACEMTDWEAFRPLESLAAALAESNSFEEAVLWQQRALGLAPEKRRAEMRARLAQYQARR